MHDDRDPEPATQTPYVATILATLTLTVPVLLWAEVGVEERGRAGKVAARPDLSQEDPQEIARARTLVAQLEQGAEKRFLHARMARVTNRRPALSELLAGGDFDGERARGEDYVSASVRWLQDIAALPERASTILEMAQIPHEVRRAVVAELELSVPARLRAGRSRSELGQRYVEFIEFVEGHRERMRFDEQGRLVLDRQKCADEFEQLARTLNRLELEVEERCPPLDGDDLLLDLQSALVRP